MPDVIPLDRQIAAVARARRQMPNFTSWSENDLADLTAALETLRAVEGLVKALDHIADVSKRVGMDGIAHTATAALSVVRFLRTTAPPRSQPHD